MKLQAENQARTISTNAAPTRHDELIPAQSPAQKPDLTSSSSEEDAI